MRQPNFSNMPTPELEAYSALVNEELAERSKREQKLTKVKAKMAALAKEEGLELDDLLGIGPKQSKKKVSTGVKVPAKYQHPKDASLQWTGRGRQPKWVAEYLKGGKKKLDSLLIKP